MRRLTIRCSAYEGCQQGCEVGVRVFLVWDVRRAERRDGAESRAQRCGPGTFPAPALRHRPSGHFIFKASFPVWAFFLSPPSGRVVPEVRSVSFVNRGRRVLECGLIWSRTSSYPSSSGSRRERPTCRACLTAATGDSAPSNRRVGSHHTSCSCEQESPGRKSSHGRRSGSGRGQSKVER